MLNKSTYQIQLIEVGMKTMKKMASEEDLVNSMAPDPRLKKTVEFVLSVRDASMELDYPINSFSDFQNKLLDKSISIEDNILEINGNDMERHIIPSYYFPIVSKENFVEKLVELRILYINRLRSQRFQLLNAIRQVNFENQRQRIDSKP
jgi:hypothetical protein